jgi:riboflavin synthase alpha subunit
MFTGIIAALAGVSAAVAAESGNNTVTVSIDLTAKTSPFE